jgi:DNA-binding transcriptional LysR family regulator
VDRLSIYSSPAESEGLLSGQYWGELRLFLEVAKAKSFNNAAKRLNLSHPTVARKVRRLQDQIGVQLLVSTERGIKLTPRGEELARALATFDQSLYAITSGLQEDPRRAEATSASASPTASMRFSRCRRSRRSRRRTPTFICI